MENKIKGQVQRFITDIRFRHSFIALDPGCECGVKCQTGRRLQKRPHDTLLLLLPLSVCVCVCVSVSKQQLRLSVRAIQKSAAHSALSFHASCWSQAEDIWVYIERTRVVQHEVGGPPRGRWITPSRSSSGKENVKFKGAPCGFKKINFNQKRKIFVCCFFFFFFWKCLNKLNKQGIWCKRTTQFHSV